MLAATTDEYIRLKQANCKNCYKCIRNCPVKSIGFTRGQAHVLPEECILCGHCCIVCPQKAKDIRNDIDRVKDLLAGDAPVIACLAPSFIASRPDLTLQGITEALLELGFSGVAETSDGANLIRREYDRLVEQATDNRAYISTCCHTVNLLVQKHFPEAIPHLAPLMSPMLTHGLQVKQLHPGARTVFIGPCFSKKHEADAYPGPIDCVITFEELADWLEDSAVSIPVTAEDAAVGKSRLFPVPGGILRSMDCSRSDYAYMIVDGLDYCIEVIQEILAGRIERCFIEMSACKGSCVNGPSMNHLTPRHVAAYRSVNQFAGPVHNTVPQLATEAMHKVFEPIEMGLAPVDEVEIAEILRKMGKFGTEDELNCSSCGYDTCRLKAKAVVRGKADLTMCLPYLKEHAESLLLQLMDSSPYGLLLLTPDLEIRQMNSALIKMLRISQVAPLIGSHVVHVLDPTPFYDVLDSGRNLLDHRIELKEYGLHVDQSIIYEKSTNVLFCLLRDISGEVRAEAIKHEARRETISVANHLINKQMRVVQEIALLLGETTAETKIALTQLKETVEREEHDD